MARIRFVGDSVSCAWLGVAFKRGEWIDDHGLSAEDLARVKANPTFEVDDSEEIAAAAAAAAEALAATKRKADADAKAAAKAALAEERAQAAAGDGASAGASGLKV